MEVVKRRLFLFTAALPLIRTLALAGAPALSIRGKLTRSRADKPALELAGRKLVALQGDADSTSILNDKRVWGTDFEALGHYASPGLFEVDPIYTRAMFVHKDGKRLMITYWCDVCSIRTLTPGTCVCCQKYTDLDLRERDDQ